MTGVIRRINLLTALALLISGLLQPLAAAQGVTCARTHPPAQEERQPDGSAIGSSSSDDHGDWAISPPHVHDSIPQPGADGAPSASCGSAAIPSQQRFSSSPATVRQLLQAGDFPLANLLIQSLFRPPRLS